MSEPDETDELATLEVDGVVVAHHVAGTGLDPTLAPRPFLHPVRTLAGVPVSDREPADHRWHLGVGVAIQDVGGVNLWGGRTYVRDAGYTWREDHGTVTHQAFRRRAPDGFAAELAWRAPDGRPLLHEMREVGAARVAGGWRLALRFTLRNATGEPLAIGSPATNGRTGAGYGGFFWRFPPLADARVCAPDADGEDAVHGSRAPWVAVSGRVRRDFGAGSEQAEPVTVLLAAADDVTRADPWFVRLSGYPGAGLSLAPERPVTLPAGGALTRAVHAVVADGMPDPARLAESPAHHREAAP
jgi:hypothetical protein